MDKARKVYELASDKKARDIVILELKDLTILTDYFIICSGDSTTQVRAIVEHIEERLGKAGLKPLSIEGLSYSHWVLMDYGDIIIHVFEEETRHYYELEKLWLDAPRIEVAKARLKES
ncbi:MAG: ribosome silencing factor [Thermodesulfovibrionales bacterium]|nr:ribosome silencing factor [Thermodesulfovibrionales bacterium]